MPVARPEPPDTRVIAHIDLDCFYVQVEQRRQPELKGKPTAVVQYNPFRGGAIIAVGYEARRAGVTRIMRGDDARKMCPDINLVQVPVAHGKADLTVYRDAGSEVVEIFSRMGICERASIDEVYLDITEAAAKRLMQSPPHARTDYCEEVLRTHVVGVVEDAAYSSVKEWLSRSFASRSDQLLACGAIIVAELRTAVVKETQFTTSAGIAHNKMLAKLASAMHKPAQQTLVPSSEVQTLLANMPTKKIKYLGGKLGRNLESDLGVKTVGDLLLYSEAKLQAMYGFNTGTWLWSVARGIDGDEVEVRILPKSHGCGKTFPGPTALKDLDSIRFWLAELSEELQERLDVDLQLHRRRARLLVVHASCHVVGKTSNSMKPFPSKSCTLRYGSERIASDAVQLFKRSLSEFCPDLPKLSPLKGETIGTSSPWAVTALSLSAHNIDEVPSGVGTITRFFSSPNTSKAKEKDVGSAHSSVSPSPVSDVSYQAGMMPQEKVCVDFQGEEVISLNELDEKILKSADLSSSHSDAAESLDVGEPGVASPSDTDDDEESYSSECELPASPNAYSVLSRRERLAWSQERESRSQQRSGKCSAGRLADGPSTPPESCSHNCKSVKRNLFMDTLDSSSCVDEDIVRSHRFGEEGHGLQPLSAIELLDVDSDYHKKDFIIDRSVGRYEMVGSQLRSAGTASLNEMAEVIQCSPLEPTRVENLAITGQRPISPVTGVHHTIPEDSEIPGNEKNVGSSADDSTSDLSRSVLLTTHSRTEQAALTGPSRQPLEDLTGRAICGESLIRLPGKDAMQMIRLQDASTGVTITHQTTGMSHLHAEEQPTISTSDARVSGYSGRCQNLRRPNSEVSDATGPGLSTKCEVGEPSRNRGLGRYKSNVFTRVDELWEKWKSSSEKSTAFCGSGSKGSPDGMNEQEESYKIAKSHRRNQRDMHAEMDSKPTGKKRRASISDFFAISPSK